MKPKQLPAVDRNAKKTAAIQAGASVGPSNWLSDILPPKPCYGIACGIPKAMGGLKEF
jgi:hypothetical protein